MYRQLTSNKRIAKNSVFMSIRMVVVLVVSLYTSRIILKALGIVDYGIYNVVAGVVTMFGFLNSSLSNGIQRFFNYELGKNGIEGANKVYNAALLIQFILAIIIIIPVEIIGNWYLHNKMVIPYERVYAANWIFHLSLLTFLFHIFQVPYSAAVMAHERMDFYAFVSILNVFITLACVFIIPSYNGDHLIFYGILITLISFVSLVIYIIYAKIKFREIYITRKFNKKLFKEMLFFSGWNVFGTLGHMLKDQGVNLVLNIYFGPIVNAARGVANQINGGLHSFVTNITVPTRPQVIQSYSCGNVYRSLNLTYTISKFGCFLLLMMSLPILLEINYVLQIWLGNNVPTHTATFVVIIVINSFLSILNAAISGIVHASGQMRKYQLAGGSISLISVIIVYVSMLFLKVPEFALLIILLMDIVRQVISLIILKTLVKEFSFKKYIVEVLMPIVFVSIISLIVPASIHLLMQEGFIRFVLVFISSLMINSVSVYIIGLTSSEKIVVKQIIKKAVGRFKGKVNS